MPSPKAEAVHPDSELSHVLLNQDATASKLYLRELMEKTTDKSKQATLQQAGW